MSFRRGDTIIEVLLAFTVFAAVAVSVTVMMNRSMATAQRSLEITLARQQVDIQADLLRYVRDNEPTVWNSIVTSLSPSNGALAGGSPCPDHNGVLPGSFFLQASDGGGPLVITRHSATESLRFSPAGYIGRVDQAAGRSEGLWVTPVLAEGSTPSVTAYDMYIRSCWNTVAQTVPMTISTIVRLYEN